MPRSLLRVFGSVLALAGAAQAVSLFEGPAKLRAHAEPATLLQGCADVPEAVALAGTLAERGQRIQAYMDDLSRRKTEIAAAERQLTEKLVELRKVRQSLQDHDRQDGQVRDDEIARIIAMYDQMKPEQAAQVLSNLPPEFAAQILLRVQPDIGARIMTAVEPRQAAVLTSFMGASRSGQD